MCCSLETFNHLNTEVNIQVTVYILLLSQPFAMITSTSLYPKKRSISKQRYSVSGVVFKSTLTVSSSYIDGLGDRIMRNDIRVPCSNTMLYDRRYSMLNLKNVYV